MNKRILHIDGDAFFVACEVAKNPKLKGLPVVTGQERGIVSALSYEAKALGITRGMPIFKVKKNFPKVIIMPGDYASYVDYSRKMFDVVRRYADVVEEYSIDECFADLTGLERPLKMTYFQIAERIKKEINEELQLSVSLGVAPTKVLAKVASKWVKPNGLTLIEEDTAMKFLSATPIEKIWGIGRQTSEFLKRKGIHFAGEFANLDGAWIRKNMSKPYEIIWLELNLFNILKISGESKDSYSSIQKTRTFHPPTNEKSFLLSQLSKHTEEACAKARHYKLVPKGISFFLKTQDFKYYSFAVNLEVPSNAPEILMSVIEKYFSKVHRTGLVYRTAGVVLYELCPDYTTQKNLFGHSELASKFEAVHDVIDNLEEKFGKRLVYLASTHKALKRKVLGTDSDDLDRNLLFL
jgi:nucleotidyltransferase/DNA polymerase involved in DNA repair